MAQKQLHIFLFFLINISLFSQSRYAGKITGIIRDAQTEAPLAYTNVFLANTTIGDAADDKGAYILDNIPPGNYQLVVSRIGYQMPVQNVIVRAGRPIDLNINLQVKRIEGEEISVVGKKITRAWKRNLREFERYFLGETANAARCTILNPEVLSFERESFTANLVATSDSIIVVENRALGYRLDIVLASFRWGALGGQYTIYPRYTELDPENERQRTRWQNNRQETYRRSMRGFFASLSRPDPFREYTVYQFKENGLSGSNRAVLLDSLNIVMLDSAHDIRRFDFSSAMQVKRLDSHISNLNLKYDYIDFDKYGNIYPPDGVSVSGYWGQFRVADTLPFDYRPEVEE